MKIIEPKVTLEAITSDPLTHIERAGRTCYKSHPKGDPRAFVDMIIARGHLSVLEHASATLRIVCDRGVTHELVRHRLASYSQESTRYCNYGSEKHGKEIKVLSPFPKDATTPEEIVHEWRDAVLRAEEAYMAMIDKGVSPQIARSVLPNSLATEIVATMNFREWLHFLKLRRSNAAQPQMREIADMVYKELCKVCYAVFRYAGKDL